MCAYKYYLKYGRRVVHCAITDNLSRREHGHQIEYPGSKLRQVGRRTTREPALEWERNGAAG